MIDIKNIKLILRDRYNMMVLSDMEGPVDINAGRTSFVAMSQRFPPHATNEHIAETIASSKKDCFAFYELLTASDGSVILRYAAFDYVFSDIRINNYGRDILSVELRTGL